MHSSVPQKQLFPRCCAAGFSDAEEYGKALTALLENADIGLIVLAGFMT